MHVEISEISVAFVGYALDDLLCSFDRGQSSADAMYRNKDLKLIV